MDASLPQNPVSPSLLFFCGLIVAGAALKEVVAHIAASPLAVAARRPSLVGTVVVGFLVKEAVGRIGSSAIRVPADR
jgi:F0F1-type ATP synthase membrane subunit c/vacuolar-type H+-ATPase subunit K